MKASAGPWRSTTDWEITGAESVDKHTGNYSLPKHTSHHQPKLLKEKIHPHPLPTSLAISHHQLLVSYPGGPADWADLTDWASFKKRVGIGPGSFPRLHARSFLGFFRSALLPQQTSAIINGQEVDAKPQLHKKERKKE